MPDPLSPKQLWVLAIPFAGGVGACYSLGYWEYFRVDPLQFVSLSDLPKLAVYPLLLIAFTATLWVAFSQVAWAPVFPPGGGNETAVGRAGLKYWRPLVAFLLVLLAASIWWLPEPGNWFIACALASVLSVALTHLPFLIALLPNPRVRGVVLLQLVLLPGLAFANARSAAVAASLGKSNLVVDVARSGTLFKGGFSEPVVYLGRLGETYVLLEQKSRSVIFVKAKDDAPLVLKREGS